MRFTRLGSVWCAWFLPALTVACGGGAPEPAAPSPATEEAADETWQDEPVGADEDAPAEDGAAESKPAGDEDDAADEATGKDDDAKPPGATVKETRTTEVIRDVVAKHRQSVRDCYEALSREERGSGGTLTISFKLDPKGNVREAKLNQERSTLKQPKLTSCAVVAIQKLKFPPSSRGFESSVNYPFDFKP